MSSPYQSFEGPSSAEFAQAPQQAVDLKLPLAELAPLHPDLAAQTEGLKLIVPGTTLPVPAEAAPEGHVVGASQESSEIDTNRKELDTLRATLLARLRQSNPTTMYPVQTQAPELRVPGEQTVEGNVVEGSLPEIPKIDKTDGDRAAEALKRILAGGLPGFTIGVTGTGEKPVDNDIPYQQNPGTPTPPARIIGEEMEYPPLRRDAFPAKRDWGRHENYRIEREQPGSELHHEGWTPPTELIVPRLYPSPIPKQTLGRVLREQPAEPPTIDYIDLGEAFRDGLLSAVKPEVLGFGQPEDKTLDAEVEPTDDDVLHGKALPNFKGYVTRDGLMEGLEIPPATIRKILGLEGDVTGFVVLPEDQPQQQPEEGKE